MKALAISKTIFPPINNAKISPSDSAITDAGRKLFFTNWNELLVEKVRDLEPRKENLKQS